MNPAELFKLLIPGLIAVVGNIIFYIIIKGRVDRSIERHKISYSGIFKEKIDIYKEILKSTYDLKFRVQQYHYHDGNDGKEIMEEFNKYIRLYSINKPFLSENIIANIKQLIVELQECFENFYMQNTISAKPGISNEKRTEILSKYFSAGNKFKTNNPFEIIENKITEQIKQELKIEGL